MKRREFLLFSGLNAAAPLVAETTVSYTDDTLYRRFLSVRALIAAVQAHMFPAGTRFPSAENVGALLFLQKAIFHPSYDKDIRRFVVEGAERLDKRTEGKFLHYTKKEKESALRKYENESYGSDWLSRILTLTLEGMLGAPVYGANPKGIVWQALHTRGGEPHPKARYLEDVL